MYTVHFEGVYRFLLSLCRDRALAEDLTQETFYRAMQALDGFRGEASAYSWLCQIAKNAYFRHSKRHGRFSPLEAMPVAEHGDAVQDLLLREDTAALHRALHLLGEPYKEVFTLRVFAELPYADIAALFGRGEAWARVTFYRAKSSLVEAMKEETP